VVDIAQKINYTELNLIIERKKDSREIALIFTIVTSATPKGMQQLSGKSIESGRNSGKSFS
jgi:hypothetical protein